jgi:CBS domain-containing protein
MESSRHATEVTVELHAHIAAAAYLMQRAHSTSLLVIANDASRRPVAIITDADIAQVIADGRDTGETYIEELVAEGRLRRPSAPAGLPTSPSADDRVETRG